MRNHVIVVPIFLLAAAYGATAAEVKIVPGDFIALNPTNPDKHYSDLMVHSVLVATEANEKATLTHLRIEVMSHGRRLLTRDVEPDEVMSGTAYLASAPFPQFVEGQVLDANGLDGVFGRHVAFATSLSMAGSQALIETRLHFSIGFEPDAVRAVASFSGATGDFETSATVPVRIYNSPIVYRAPLDGEWLMQAVPGVQSHHRFNPSTEFAVDFFKLGPDGHVAHGELLDPNNFYGFGSPVRAAAAGTVVNVIADQVQDRAALTRKDGEPSDTFMQRVNAYHMAQMKKNFWAGNAGNLVTIRHEKDGAVEFSSYGHLKSGSVRVHVGDEVAQGTIIGEVGDTGDSAAVHLHFQVNAGPNPFTSKSLPATFANLRSVDGNAEMGRLVMTSPDDPG